MSTTLPKIMVATPMYGGMCAGHYVNGMISTISKTMEIGLTVYWTYMTNESLITRARNELVRIFLTSDADYLMFIDADISFDGNAILQLLDGGKDIACGVYPKKEIVWSRIQEAADRGEKNLKEHSGSFVMNILKGYSQTDEKGFIEVSNGGTGFMLIKRSVFEFLKDHVPTYRASSAQDEKTGEYVNPLTHEFFATSIMNGTLLSEDYHFCELWRRHGGKVYINPFIKLEHIGTYIYTGDVKVSGGNLQAKEQS